MKNILVPVGESENAKNLVQYAIDFSAAFDATLYVVQVYNVYTKAGTMIKVDHIIEREGQESLKQLISELDTKGVTVIPRTIKGALIETLELAAKHNSIDLIMIEPKTTSIKDEVFLGKTSGKIIKKTNIPTLIVPEDYTFKPFNKILMAMKSTVIKRVGVLNPLQVIKTHFQATVNLLLVKTSNYKEGDFEENDELLEMVNNTTTTENATTFQGVLEHFQSNNPDMLCVVRRKRGFFAKKWEKNTILKKNFHSSKPVLVLRGFR